MDRKKMTPTAGLTITSRTQISSAKSHAARTFAQLGYCPGPQTCDRRAHRENSIAVIVSLWFIYNTEKGVMPVYTNPQKLPQNGVLESRQQAGRWLKELREARRLSQRGLADRVGAEYYTFISQIEAGRGRIPPDRYEFWAAALGVEPKAFVQTLLRYYDPLTHAIVFGDV